MLHAQLTGVERASEIELFDNNGLEHRRRAWGLCKKDQQQQNFDSSKPTDKLAHLQVRQDEAIHNYFTQTQELLSRGEQTGEHLPKPLCNSIQLKRPPEH